MKYQTALIIGRFQPFHPGHLHLIQDALQLADKVIIGIGSSNLTDIDNPYDFETRREMVQTALKKAGIGEKIKKIVPIPDTPSDDEWLDLAIKQTGPVDVVVGQNDWVNDLYAAKGYPVVKPTLYKRHIYEGRKIREKMRQNGQLK